ncbi:alpha/beta hydrolase [Tsukamurella soli]|uniref:alpha/beta hydrolase n=1 Tax=Tsukamurella soli TaxID=644556 RepID=UPI0031E8BD16
MATHLTDVIAAEEFAGYGALIFPNSELITTAMTVTHTARLLPYHSNVHPGEVADTLNAMRTGARDGALSFQRIYGDSEIVRDRAKADVGLFRFRGAPGAPFAIVSPGGGFSYLARAIDYVFEHAAGLEVCTDGYSLWGSSAGARMAANLAGYGTAAFGGAARPSAGTVVMAYTGHSDTDGDVPPTFAVVGSNDGIASPAIMAARIRRLERAGVQTEFRRYPGLGHGFGLGTGTVAQGWVDAAMDFWEAQRGQR